MKILILSLSLFLFSCNKTAIETKPLITISEFDKQSIMIVSLIMKFVNENNPEVLHQVSLAIESTFAIDCKPIGNECNQYHDIVTKIIQATQDRKFTIEERMLILKSTYQLEETLKQSRTKLVNDWKKYQ